MISVDAQTLRKDPMLTTLVLEQKNRGKKPDKKQEELSSAPTLCRMENRVDRASLKRLIQLQIDLYLQRNQKRFEHEMEWKTHLFSYSSVLQINGIPSI